MGRQKLNPSTSHPSFVCLFSEWHRTNDGHPARRSTACQLQTMWTGVANTQRHQCALLQVMCWLVNLKPTCWSKTKVWNIRNFISGEIFAEKSCSGLKWKILLQTLQVAGDVACSHVWFLPCISAKQAVIALILSHPSLLPAAAFSFPSTYQAVWPLPPASVGLTLPLRSFFSPSDLACEHLQVVAINLFFS